MSLPNVRMMTRHLTGVLKSGACALLLLVLAACDSVEERVAEHYERGQALLAEGAPQKAILEFNNALQLDENHAPSHFAIGQIRETRGELQPAFTRYIKASELDPNHADARLKLARFLLLGNDTDKAKEELAAALRLAPQNAEAHALDASISLRAGDAVAAKAALDRAIGLAPGNAEVALAEIAYLQKTAGNAAALVRTDEILAEHHQNLSLYLLKLQLLEQGNDQVAIGAHLATMISIFPEEIRLHQARAQWALQNDDMETAEAELRAIVKSSPDGHETVVTLIRFLRQHKGEESARAELFAQIDQAAKPFPLEMMLAQFDVETGNTDAAIVSLRDLTQRATGDNANQARVTLSQLLIAQGKTEEAYALVDAVLVEDPSNIEASILQAVRLIDNQKYDDAIQMVRTALSEAPDDQRLLMLASRVQELSGNINLASDRLAKAVRGSAYEPSIVERYVEFLQRSNRDDAAETVLSEAIKRHNDNPRLLDLLASMRLQLEDWAGAEPVIQRLAALDADRARQLRGALLIGQEQFPEGAALLRDLPENAAQQAASITAIVQTYIREGKQEEAEIFLDELLLKNPKNIQVLGLRGNLYAAAGDQDMAKGRYEAILKIEPNNGGAYSALARLRQSAGDLDGAEAILRTGLEASPENVTLMVRLAERLERKGDIEGAIEIYTRAYRQVPDALLVVNNLASLLSDKRAGASQNINLAYQIAGRLRNADLPHYRDTYGWTRYLKNEYKEALEHLKPAAEALSDNPWVLYHVGMTYVALKQSAEARQYLEAALIQSEGMDFPQATEIHETLASLQ